MLVLLFSCFSTIPFSYSEPQPTIKELGSVRIVASGDTLMHYRVKKTAALKNIKNSYGVSQNNGGYDWILEDVAPIFQKADIAFVNLESPTDPDYHRRIKGEIFNAPPVFLSALASAGIDIVSFANNHSFDQGPLGLLRTLKELDDRGLSYVGAGKTCFEARALKVLVVGKLKVGFLGMSDLMNINDNQSEEEPCVDIPGPKCIENCLPDRDALFYHIEEEELLKRISQAKKQVDVLVLSFHWGIEYNRKPLPLYSKLAPKLIDAGVDLLLGHHSHTLQPVLRHTRPNGDEGLIAYSLGNLFSDMSRSYKESSLNYKKGRTRDGLLLSVSLQVLEKTDGTRQIRIPEYEMTPLWTENNNNKSNPEIRVRRHSTILAETPDKKDFIETRKKSFSFLELGP